MFADYHVHTEFSSDSVYPMEQVLEDAIAMGMDDASQRLEQYGVQAQWDETTKQNYAQWEADGGVYKIWLEDADSLEEKMKLIKSQNLAGVAEWSLGMENAEIWNLILQYVN